MPKYFTHYRDKQGKEEWGNWRHSRVQGRLPDYAGSSDFVREGVQPGDILYSVTIFQGNLYLLGKLRVQQMTTKEDAAAILGVEPIELYCDRAHYIVADAATPIRFDNIIPMDEVRALRVIRAKGIVKELRFRGEGLDGQTLRGVTKLTPESAALLDTHLEEMQAIDLPREPV